MRTVFDLNNEGTIILNPHAVKLCPGLKSLKQDELLYIIWIYDYRSSPLRLKPEDQRLMYFKRKFPNNKVKKEKIENSIQEYLSLIYSVEHIRLENAKNKLKEAEKAFMDTDITATTTLKSLSSTSDFLEKKIMNLETKIESEEELVDLKGKKKLSFLELQKRQDNFMQS